MKIICFLLLLFFTELLPASSFGLLWVPPTRVRGATSDNRLRTCLFSSRSSEDITDNSTPNIDRQSDIKYGRGMSHISADLNEEDIIAYQDGTWYVDGNEVGDGSNPIVKYLQVDTIQLVWTHNCEHGVINGFDLMVANDNAGIASIEESGGAIVERGSYLVITNDYLQIGPEQILARIPTTSLKQKWKNTESDMVLSRADFDPDEEITTS